MTKDNQKDLRDLVKQEFGCEQRRASFISLMVIALITMCSVSYSKLALVLNPAVKKASNFKRIQRFFKDFTFSFSTYISFVFKILRRDGIEDKFILAIDRTNWKFGVLNINILMIAVVYNGTSIPLIWSLLDKRGNSNQHERILLIRALRKLTRVADWNCLRCITMDREFEGKKWLSYLQSLGLPFVLRIKKSANVQNRSKTCKVWQLFECDYHRVMRKTRKVFGLNLYLSGRKITDSKGKTDYVIFLSDMQGAKVATYYAERWGIEVLFGDLKTRGFNFEDTHVTNLKSIQKMIFFLSLAYIWAIKTGEWLVEKGVKIPLKMVNERLTKLYSTFRIGLDHLRVKCIHKLDMDDLMILLSCT